MLEPMKRINMSEENYQKLRPFPIMSVSLANLDPIVKENSFI